VIGRKGTITVIVVEGVGLSRLDELCRRGLLPGFSRLLAEGRHGPLRTRVAAYEAPMLASAWTGVTPGEHGCFSYWHVHSSDGPPRIFEPFDLAAAPLWDSELLSDRRFLLVNLFGCDTSRPGRHTMIGYPFRQTMSGCQPRTLLGRLARAGLGYLHDVMAFYRGEPLADFLELLISVEEKRIRAVRALAEDPHDVLIANLTIADRVGHFYEHELAGDGPLEDTAALAAYRMLDAFVAPLADAEGDVIVFSELGFGPLREFVSFNDVLAAASLLAPPVEPDRSFDPARTVAFEAVQGSHGVNINLAGRYPRGAVAAHDYERVRADVRASLLAARHPATGNPLLADVVPREELYRGPAVERAPDLVLVPADERYLPLGDPFWANHVNRRLQTGWHRSDGFWIGRGPGFRGDAAIERAAAPEDIGATIFALAGRDPPGGVAGVPLCC
jgi:hypothetical protein